MPSKANHTMTSLSIEVNIRCAALRLPALMAALHCRYTPATETTLKLHIPLERATNRAEVDFAAAAAAGANPIPCGFTAVLRPVPL